MSCNHCDGSGFTYDGSGHRFSGYPYAEMTVMVACKRCNVTPIVTLEDKERLAQVEADNLMAINSRSPDEFLRKHDPMWYRYEGEE